MNLFGCVLFAHPERRVIVCGESEFGLKWFWKRLSWFDRTSTQESYYCGWCEENRLNSYICRSRFFFNDFLSLAPLVLISPAAARDSLSHAIYSCSSICTQRLFEDVSSRHRRHSGPTARPRRGEIKSYWGKWNILYMPCREPKQC